MKGSKRKSLFRDLFSSFDEFDELFESTFKDIQGLEGGYSIEVTQSAGRTVVKAKVGKDVSVQELRRELEEQYPGAEIIIEGGKPSIEEIGEVGREERIEKRPSKQPSPEDLFKQRTRKPHIEEVKD
ncbi:MAG: hypothetical protein QXQ28_04090 [Candidatus Nezhaarchaeales archaeon]